MRICKICKKEKDESKFVKSKNCISGIRRTCKECRNIYKTEDRRKRGVRAASDLSPWTKTGKICFQCKKDKPLSEFPKQKNSECKSCQHENYIKKKRQNPIEFNKKAAKNQAKYLQQLRENNPNKLKAIRRNNSKKIVEKLSGKYVRHLLKHKHGVLNPTKEIVEAKKLLITIKRLTNEKKTSG